MSIYVTRLESLLLPGITDPAFSIPLQLNNPSSPLNPTQRFCVSVAHATWETCEVLERALEKTTWPKFVEESLRPVMDKFDLIVGKVVKALLLGVKHDLELSLTSPEASPIARTAALPTVPLPVTSPIDPKEPSPSRVLSAASQSGQPRGVVVPTSLQNFASRVDAARKVFELIAMPCADDGEGWITNVVVGVIWLGVCLASDRKPFTRPPSPASAAKIAYNAVYISRLSSTTAKILPSRSASRAPSPPRSMDQMTHYLVSLEGLIKRLVGNLVPPPLTAREPGQPIPTVPSFANVQGIPAAASSEHLARGALHEALEALTSARIVSTALHGSQPAMRLYYSAKRIRDDIDLEAEEQLDDAVEDVPAISLWTTVIVLTNSALSYLEVDEKEYEVCLRIRTPPEIFGMGENEYGRTVLASFSSAEEWSRRVGLGLKGDVEQVLKALIKKGASPDELQGHTVPSDEKRYILHDAVTWVRALGITLETRAGIKLNVPL